MSQNQRKIERERERERCHLDFVCLISYPPADSDLVEASLNTGIDFNEVGGRGGGGKLKEKK